MTMVLVQELKEVRIMVVAVRVGSRDGDGDDEGGANGVGAGDLRG